MNLVNPSLRRPFTVVVLVIAVVAGAVAALRKMPRDVFPALGIPTIYVAQPYGGMDRAQMEGYLTYYYEYHFLYITGIEHVESKSIQGAVAYRVKPADFHYLVGVAPELLDHWLKSEVPGADCRFAVESANKPK